MSSLNIRLFATYNVEYLGIVQNCSVYVINVPDSGMGKTLLARNTVEVLVVENDVEKRTVDFKLAVVVDEGLS